MKVTRAATVAAYFRARPNTWISALDIMAIGGALSWRTRVSDCRKAPYFMNVVNRTRKVGSTLYSEYMNVEEVKEPRKAGQEPFAAALPL